MDSELGQDLILQSLLDSFSQFVLNYHMNKLNTSLPELLKIAKSHSKGDKAHLLLVDERNKQAKKKGLKKSSTLRGASKIRRKLRRLIEPVSTMTSKDIGRKITRHILQV